MGFYHLTAPYIKIITFVSKLFRYTLYSSNKFGNFLTNLIFSIASGFWVFSKESCNWYVFLIEKVVDL